MSTVKVDRIQASLLPLPLVEGVGDLQSFVVTPGQVQFTLAEFDSSVQLRVFVEGDEATWNWVSPPSNIIEITSPASIPTGYKVRVYKVIGELAYKNYSDIADLVSDEALINAIIFG